MLLVAIAVGPFAASNMPGPEPPPIVFNQLTPEAINAQFQAERKQIQYDEAEEIASRVFRSHGCSDEFAEHVAHSAIDQHMNVRVLAALIVVESTCRPGVVSSEGAVGLMQVMPRVWHVDAAQLKDPEFNIRTGTAILASYTRAHGLVEGLHRYNGLGVGCEACDGQYGNKVLLVAGFIRR